MKLFNQDFVDMMQAHCDGEEIESVQLGKFTFTFSFGKILSFQNELKVKLHLQGLEYIWKGGATTIPVGQLIGQIPQKFILKSPEIVEMYLKSGDIVSFYTNEEPYETCVITFLPEGNTTVLEIF